jgi:putative FmdB family regulatory protein
MLYPYECQICEKKFDEVYKIGDAPRETVCPDCKGLAKRTYDNVGISFSQSVVTNPTTFGEQMKARNREAAHRMKGREAPVRVTAYDHGNGDVREVIKPKTNKK